MENFPFFNMLRCVIWVGPDVHTQMCEHLLFSEEFHWQKVFLCKFFIIIIIIIKIESAVQGRGRMRPLYQSEDNNPTQPTHGNKKRENIRDKKKKRLGHQESTGSALKTRQSHTIKYRVTKIAPERQWEEHKGSREIQQKFNWIQQKFNECIWATKAPQVTCAGSYGKANALLKGCIRLFLILNSMHNSAIDRRWARVHSKTPPAKNTAPLTTLLGSLRCESAAEHDTAEQHSKTPKRFQKRRPIMKYLPGLSRDTNLLSCSHGNRMMVLLKGHLHQALPPIWQGQQIPSAQFYRESNWLTGDELCVTWRIS